MMHQRNKRRRRSIRKPGFDYRDSGTYFVTIYTHHPVHLFEDVRERVMHVHILIHINNPQLWDGGGMHAPIFATHDGSTPSFGLVHDADERALIERCIQDNHTTWSTDKPTP